MAVVTNNLLFRFVIHQQVAVSLAKGIADFVENEFQAVVLVVTEIDAERVEGIPQNAWIAE